jgi:hypothetical protein
LDSFQGPLSLEHWSPSWGLPSPPSFSFYLKCEFGYLSFFSWMWFSIWIFENLFLQLSLVGEEWLIVINGGKRENKWDDSSTFERMEMIRGKFGAWNLQEISLNLLGFVAYLKKKLGVSLRFSRQVCFVVRFPMN